MSWFKSALSIFRDALQRHGNVTSLLHNALGILRVEGVKGLLHRKRLHRDRLSARTNSTGPLARKLAPGLNLIGHPYAVLGRAEDIRTAAMACHASSIPFVLMNLHGEHDVHKQGMHLDFPFFDLVQPGPTYSTNLFYLNADEMGAAYHRYGADFFLNHYNIGCFAWELSIFPQAWYESFAHLQEIWAPTKFIQQALEQACPLPVIHMPFVVEPGAAGEDTRESLGLPQDRFLFLFFFDFRSFIQRKNPQAVLEAFFQAFPSGSKKNVHLVIKINGNEDKPDEYRKFLEDERLQDDRVQLIATAMDDRGIKSLVSLCDCFVSLHRSEGFGRGLAEAMYYGKPVIATAYSGNMDYMTVENSCLVEYTMIPLQPNDYPYWQNQYWADADISQAAEYMIKLVDDRPYAELTGARASATIRTFHSSQAVGKLQRQRLEAAGLL